MGERHGSSPTPGQVTPGDWILALAWTGRGPGTLHHSGTVEAVEPYEPYPVVLENGMRFLEREIVVLLTGGLNSESLMRWLDGCA